MRRSTAEAPALDEMVLTDPMGITGNGYTRRGVLGGTAGATLSMTTLAGCGLFDNSPAPDKAADPLQPVLAEALALAAAYDRAVVAQPGLGNRLTPLAADHRAHATELAKVIGEKLPSGAPAASAAPASDAAGTVAGLRKAEQAAQKTAAVACRQAVAARAALVGSIAACRATHAEALR
jgi:hypothetical protein